jgi:DNA repair exonuclease SbcCD ATPase subunit
MFHGQFAINELLESSDTKLKDELSLVVPVSIWQEAVAHTRKKAREASKEVAKLEGMVELRSEDLAQLENRLKATSSSFESKERIFMESHVLYRTELDTLSSNVEDPIGAYDLITLEEAMQEAAETVDAIGLERQSMVETRNTQVRAQEKKVGEIAASVASASDQIQSLQSKIHELSFKEALAKERVGALEETWSADLSSGVQDSFSVPSNCPTCGQSISDSGDGHSHHDIVTTVKRDFEDAIVDLNDSRTNLHISTLAMNHAEKVRGEAAQELLNVQKALDQLVFEWTTSLGEIDERLDQARNTYNNASDKFTTAAKRLQRDSRIQSLNEKINAAGESIKMAKEAVDTARTEFETCRSRLTKIHADKQDQAHVSRAMSDLSDAFGQRGIQTFVLQNAVSLLESTAQSYLDNLSEGAQRLQLCLDAGDRISRRAYVRGENGMYKERALAALSGGQWRRCSLSLNLAFADIVAHRGKFRPSLCVMDEPLTHLDHTGRADVGRVLRQLLRRTSEASIYNSLGFKVSTILIILQDLAAVELEESFDCIDEVVKENGVSTLLVEGTTA